MKKPVKTQIGNTLGEQRYSSIFEERKVGYCREKPQEQRQELTKPWRWAQESNQTGERQALSLLCHLCFCEGQALGAFLLLPEFCDFSLLVWQNSGIPLGGKRFFKSVSPNDRTQWPSLVLNVSFSMPTESKALVSVIRSVHLPKI